MTPEQWDKISRIFNEATSLRADARADFVREECKGDVELIAEVESLLKAHDEAGGFIEDPIVENLVSDISEMPTLTGKSVGPYRIEKSIGRGGMGDVYLATDTRLDRLVAVKKLPERLAADPLFVRRFRTEAKAAATIHHSNVATLFSIEEFDDRPWITMEYVEGKTLDIATPAEGMELSRFLDIFIQVTEALRHAHERGVVHRDVKPGNIMITPDGTVKMLDFGLAQITDDSQFSDTSSTTLTQKGQILGTPSYMSPEQAQADKIDSRTDIFSLGVVMYEALSGSRPFQGDSNAEVVSNILKTEPVPIDELRPDIPGLVSRLVTRCIQKRPSDRPQSMQEIRTILGEARRLMRAGVSTGSFARRLYRESTSVGLWIRVAPVLLVIGLTIAAWLYFSRESAPLISSDQITMRRLSDTNNVGYAQISPDGKSVAFATFDPAGTRALWIRRIDDRNALQLVPPTQEQFFWGGLAISPDGGQVFYITADRIANVGTLYRVSSLGGPSRKLSDLANDVGGVSPDGERLLFVRYGEPSQILSIKTSDGSDERVVQTGVFAPPISSNFRDPQFSGDGKSVFYIRYQQMNGVEEYTVEEMPLDGGDPLVILRQPERISELAVLPDSRGLLATAVDPISNIQQVFHISLPDGKKTRVTNDLFFYFGVSVDRDGRNIVASQRADEQRVWIGNANDLDSVRPLNQDQSAYRYVDWTRDGRIVYDGRENNVVQIWSIGADGRNLQRLTASESDDQQPRVSPDGRYIIFSSRRNGRPQVWRMDIDGNNQMLLTDVPGTSGYPKFSSDGQVVVFQWERDGKRSLASVPLSGGQVTEIESLDSIPVNNSYYWAASPDGKYIAHSIWDAAEKKMKVVIDETASGQRVKVLNIWPAAIMKWANDSKSIYYRERQIGYIPEFEVQRVDIATGRTTPLLSTAPELILDLTYSPDGQKLAIVRGRSASNAIMLTPIPTK